MIDDNDVDNSFACVAVDTHDCDSAPPVFHMFYMMVKVTFSLEQTPKTPRGSRGLSLLFNLGDRWGGWSAPRPGRFYPGNDLVPIED